MVDAFADAGHDVTVVTNFPSFPRGRFAEGRRPLMRVENDGDVRTVRLFSMLIPGYARRADFFTGSRLRCPRRSTLS